MYHKPSPPPGLKYLPLSSKLKAQNALITNATADTLHATAVCWLLLLGCFRCAFRRATMMKILFSFLLLIYFVARLCVAECLGGTCRGMNTHVLVLSK